MRTLPLLALACAIATFETALGAEGDMHTGSFDGYWCGSKARFDIKKREGKSWVFNGKVLILPTSEYDNIRIEQMEDNGLQMDRPLTGGWSGRTQSVRTYPPQTLAYKSGGTYSLFTMKNKSGYGCSGNTLMYVPTD